MFKLIQQSRQSQARLGRLVTAHGIIKTPFFMPIASKASVKALTVDDLGRLNTQIILSNSYHLYLQPGMQTIKKFKGLHNFMHWSGPILTDSGGYQVFSLSARSRNGKSLRKISKKGVEFQSFIDGSWHLFTPVKVQQIQDNIGSDIKMVLDVCSPYPSSRQQAQRDMELTHLWALEALKYHQQKSPLGNLLFGIVQGSTYKELRIKSAKFLAGLDFDGLAVGGLAVGEPNKKMYQTLEYLMEYLPNNKPRYLMGVGKPENIVQAVKKGIDMFDCVIPTREARHGRLYVFTDKKLSANFYKIVNINNAKYKNSIQPLDKHCSCDLCVNYSLGYLHHLFKAQEPLALRLATWHNLQFYLNLMRRIRLDIKLSKL